jgi:hypothetical protein
MTDHVAHPRRAAHKEKAMVLQEAQTPVAQTCRHHWMIQTADGPVSLGVCRFCFEARDFRNSVDDWMTNNTSKTSKVNRGRDTLDADFFDSDG